MGVVGSPTFSFFLLPCRSPAPCQAITYDHILTGRDIIGKSRTGTGKTIAFGLPVIQHLGRFAEDHERRTYQRGRSPRFLVVCPTRELARQVGWFRVWGLL